MQDAIRGKTIRWTFSDGPTKGKNFEHEFGSDGTLKYRMEGGKTTTENKYEVEQISTDVCAVSYLASSGWTLTCVLDFATGKVVGFASNDKQLVVQHGTFETVRDRAA
jgi:MoaF N-terminal domain